MVDFCAVPIVFALLEEKTYDAYRCVFEAIGNRIPGWAPLRCVCYFEQAAYNALKSVYPNVIVSGCMFHMGKCIWRFIQTLPFLKNQYNHNNFKVAAKCIQACAFVPRQHLYTFFCVAMTKLNELANGHREVLGIKNKPVYFLYFLT